MCSSGILKPKVCSFSLSTPSFFGFSMNFCVIALQRLPGVLKSPQSAACDRLWMQNSLRSGRGIHPPGDYQQRQRRISPELLRGLFHGFWIKWDINSATGTGKELPRKCPLIYHLNDHCLAQHECHKSLPLISSRSDCSERSLLFKAQRV